VHGGSKHASRQWRACMHVNFTHVQTYFACIFSGTGGVAGNLCILHGEARVHGGGQRASKQWRASMHACTIHPCHDQTYLACILNGADAVLGLYKISIIVAGWVCVRACMYACLRPCLCTCACVLCVYVCACLCIGVSCVCVFICLGMCACM
jgi:hypothetical protein